MHKEKKILHFFLHKKIRTLVKFTVVYDQIRNRVKTVHFFSAKSMLNNHCRTSTPKYLPIAVIRMLNNPAMQLKNYQVNAIKNAGRARTCSSDHIINDLTTYIIHPTKPDPAILDLLFIFLVLIWTTYVFLLRYSHRNIISRLPTIDGGRIIHKR